MRQKTWSFAEVHIPNSYGKNRRRLSNLIRACQRSHCSSSPPRSESVRIFCTVCEEHLLVCWQQMPEVAGSKWPVWTGTLRWSISQDSSGQPGRGGRVTAENWLDKWRVTMLVLHKMNYMLSHRRQPHTLQVASVSRVQKKEQRDHTIFLLCLIYSDC